MPVVARPGEPGQTPYSVLKPASWNGALVLDLDFNGWNATQRQWFLEQGYAIGGMARTQNQSAYEIHQYIDNYVTIRRLFIEKQCAHCHGSDGKGGVNLADRDIDPARAFETIANGRVSGNARMPAWRDLLSDDEIREAIAYVMSLSAK